MSVYRLSVPITVITAILFIQYKLAIVGGLSRMAGPVA